MWVGAGRAASERGEASCQRRDGMSGSTQEPRGRAQTHHCGSNPPLPEQRVLGSAALQLDLDVFHPGITPQRWEPSRRRFRSPSCLKPLGVLASITRWCRRRASGENTIAGDSRKGSPRVSALLLSAAQRVRPPSSAEDCPVQGSLGTVLIYGT